jgi:hypothetical protein
MNLFPLAILNKFFQQKKRILALVMAFASLLPLAHLLTALMRRYVLPV